MASIEKHGSNTLYFIKHNVRELPPNKTPSNLEIDESKKDQNYSIIRRGKNATEINKYRKEVMKELFKYNRKNLVQSVEVCITLPKDCPVEQEKAFFQESYNYVVSTLPMGEKCVFLGEVHADEGHIQKDGLTVVEGAKHLHIMYVPGVPDPKHDKYDFKLCADALTKRAQLKEFHPKFQKWLDDAGIKATVNSGVTGGKNISVLQLKEITKETGLSLDEIKDLKLEKNQLQTKVIESEKKAAELSHFLTLKDKVILDLQSLVHEKDNEIVNIKQTDITIENEVAKLKDQLHQKEIENENLKSIANHIISNKEQQLQTAIQTLSEKEQELSLSEQQNEKLQERIRTLEKENEIKQQELDKSHEKISELKTILKNTEHEKSIETAPPEKERTWGSNTWGSENRWGNKDKTIEEEKAW